MNFDKFHHGSIAQSQGHNPNNSRDQAINGGHRGGFQGLYHTGQPAQTGANNFQGIGTDIYNSHVNHTFNTSATKNFNSSAFTSNQAEQTQQNEIVGNVPQEVSQFQPMEYQRRVSNIQSLSRAPSSNSHSNDVSSPSSANNRRQQQATVMQNRNRIEVRREVKQQQPWRSAHNGSFKENLLQPLFQTNTASQGFHHNSQGNTLVNNGDGIFSSETFQNQDLRMILHICQNIELIRDLMRQERFDDVAMQLFSTMRQTLDYQVLSQQQKQDFYSKLNEIYSQSNQEPTSEPLEMKSIDINILLEIFEILCNIIAILISKHSQINFLREFVELSERIKISIDLNLEENEFEGISDFEQEIIKQQNNARLYSNMSCFFSKYLKDQKSSQIYGIQATQAEEEIYNLKRVQESQRDTTPDEVQEDTSMMTGIAVGYNNQAVIQLKQNNPDQALKLSEQSVMILEQAVFQQINNSQAESFDLAFEQQVQSLLIAYINLGMSNEMLNSMQRKDTLMIAKQIYEQGLSLAVNHYDPESLLTKKLKFKVYKIGQKLRNPNHNSIQSPPQKQYVNSPRDMFQMPQAEIYSPTALQVSNQRSGQRSNSSSHRAQVPSQRVQVNFGSQNFMMPVQNPQATSPQPFLPGEFRQMEEATAHNPFQVSSTSPTPQNHGVNHQSEHTPNRKPSNSKKASNDKLNRYDTSIQQLSQEQMSNTTKSYAFGMRLPQMEEGEELDFERAASTMQNLQSKNSKKYGQQKSQDKEKEEHKESQTEKVIEKLLKQQEENMHLRIQQIEHENGEKNNEMLRKYEEMLKTLQNQLEDKNQRELEEKKSQMQLKMRLEKEELMKQELEAQRRQLEQIQQEKNEFQRKQAELQMEQKKRIDENMANQLLAEQQMQNERKLHEMQMKMQQDMQAEMLQQKLKMQEELYGQREAMRKENEQMIHEQEELRKQLPQLTSDSKLRVNNTGSTQSRDQVRAPFHIHQQLTDLSLQQSTFNETFPKQLSVNIHEIRDTREETIYPSNALPKMKIQNFPGSKNTIVTTDAFTPLRLSDQDVPAEIKQEIPMSQPDITRQRSPEFQQTLLNSAQQSALSKINLNDIKDSSITHIIEDEAMNYDASRALMNSGSQILKEIDVLGKIVVSKVVYSKGMYHKFTVIARSHAKAIQDISYLTTKKHHSSEVYQQLGQQQVFQFVGVCEDPQINFHTSTLYYTELMAIFKVLVTQEVLPSYMLMKHIRTFEDICRYILFPFLQLFIPKYDISNSEVRDIEIKDSNDEISSQISHNLSNHSQPNRTQIELWGRAPGLLKQSLVITFLGDYSNIGVHYIEGRQFRISITSLEKDNRGLNQLNLDLIFDQQSFEYFFVTLDAREFTQRWSENPIDQSDIFEKEIFIEAVEALDQEFFKIIQPSILAYESYLVMEFGREVTFDQIVIDNRNLIQEVRISEASEDQEAKAELWIMTDKQREGVFTISCQTMYSLQIKKRLNTKVDKKFICPYQDFNALFGIRKHELERIVLILFCERYLRTLKLFMPTMYMSKGAEEDSDYEEEVFIKQMDIISLCCARKFLPYKSNINERPEHRLVTIELLGVNQEHFLGIRVQQFNRQELKEEGFFIFVNQHRWALSEEEKDAYGVKKLAKRRSKKEPLNCHYWLSQIMYDEAFKFIFDTAKFKNETLLWEIFSQHEEERLEFTKVDVIESNFSPDDVNKEEFELRMKKQ